MRLKQRSSVVFPDPLSPTSATDSPDSTLRETASRASVLSYLRVTSWAVSTGDLRHGPEWRTDRERGSVWLRTSERARWRVRWGNGDDGG
jgi:hypothetical protein